MKIPQSFSYVGNVVKWNSWNDRQERRRSTDDFISHKNKAIDCLW